jgi:hypothetical protein
MRCISCPPERDGWDALYRRAFFDDDAAGPASNDERHRLIAQSRHLRRNRS